MESAELTNMPLERGEWRKGLSEKNNNIIIVRYVWILLFTLVGEANEMRWAVSDNWEKVEFFIICFLIYGFEKITTLDHSPVVAAALLQLITWVLRWLRSPLRLRLLSPPGLWLLFLLVFIKLNKTTLST